MNALSIAGWISLAIAFICSAVISVDEISHPQKMSVMNVVWPVTALYFGVFGLWGYFRLGRRMAADQVEGMKHKTHAPETASKAQEPTLSQIAISASHCGAGCAIGDVIAEFLVYALQLSVLGVSLYASFVVDYALAWTIGIAFQYFSIQPMRHLPPGQALRAAIKADTLSITTFQVGMYGWMALNFFLLHPRPHLLPIESGFWLMMQIAMVCGFVTTMPANRWLLRKGWKETMG